MFSFTIKQTDKTADTDQTLDETYFSMHLTIQHWISYTESLHIKLTLLLKIIYCSQSSLPASQQTQLYLARNINPQAVETTGDLLNGLNKLHETL